MARLKRSYERWVATVEAAHLFAPQTAQSFWIVQRRPSSDPVEGVLPSLRSVSSFLRGIVRLRSLPALRASVTDAFGAVF